MVTNAMVRGGKENQRVRERIRRETMGRENPKVFVCLFGGREFVFIRLFGFFKVFSIFVSTRSEDEVSID